MDLANIADVAAAAAAAAAESGYPAERSRAISRTHTSTQRYAEKRESKKFDRNG